MESDQRGTRLSSVYRRAAAIALVYVLVASVWISYSDRAIESLAGDVQRLTQLQTYKGWFFVVVTGGLLFVMTALGFRTIADREGRYRALARHLEARVVERTQALESANRELTTALERLGRTQDELIRAEKLAALGTLVAGIAHELGTPIGNGVITASTLDEYAAEFRARIDAEAIRRSELAEFAGRLRAGADLLQRNLHKAAELLASFKQVAVDRASTQRRRFRLADLLGETLLTLSPRLRKTPFEVRTDVPGDLEFDSYPGALGQVVSNLVDNAVVHGLDGRRSGLVALRAFREGDGDTIVLEVSDDGAGIAPEHQPRVFDPFFTTRLGRGGSGLGLHIAHNLVTGVLGGRIGVASQPGGGTTFTLALPIRAPADGA